MLEDVNDEIPLFTEREQETVLEGEPIGTKVTQVNAIDKDGTFPNNRVRLTPDINSRDSSTTTPTLWSRNSTHNLAGLENVADRGRRK